MKLLIWQFLSDWTRRMSSTRIQQECGFSNLKYLKMPLQHGVLAWFRHIRRHRIAQRIDLKMLGTPWYPISSTGSSWSPWHLWIEVAMCSALSWIISWKSGHPDLHSWSNSLWPKAFFGHASDEAPSNFIQATGWSGIFVPGCTNKYEWNMWNLELWTSGPTRVQMQSICAKSGRHLLLALESGPFQDIRKIFHLLQHICLLPRGQ